MAIETFTVQARGIGRADFSKTIERSVQPFITPTLRQDRFTITDAIVTVPFLAFPNCPEFPLTLPQEDGSWGWLASSIRNHFFELGVFIMTNHLVTVGLLRYASIEDYQAGNVAQRSPQIFGYGKAELTFLKGIPTQEGSLYSILAGGWPDTATGTHTEAAHPTIMTDATAHFVVNEFVGLTIFNLTDGSSGVVTANTETTITVVALEGGLTNQWNPGDVYSIGYDIGVTGSGIGTDLTLPWVNH
jgi:hypothetical protein